MTDIRIGSIIEAELNERLEQLAKQNHRSKSAEIVVAIEKHVAWPFAPGTPLWTPRLNSGGDTT